MSFLPPMFQTSNSISKENVNRTHGITLNRRLPLNSCMLPILHTAGSDLDLFLLEFRGTKLLMNPHWVPFVTNSIVFRDFPSGTVV